MGCLLLYHNSQIPMICGRGTYEIIITSNSPYRAKAKLYCRAARENQRPKQPGSEIIKQPPACTSSLYQLPTSPETTRAVSNPTTTGLHQRCTPRPSGACRKAAMQQKANTTTETWQHAPTTTASFRNRLTNHSSHKPLNVKHTLTNIVQ